MRLAAYLVPALFLTLALPAAPARAQADPSMDPAQCDALARMPNAPMTAEACRSLLASSAAMQAAQASPEGRRPGDEDMTCEQIIAELKTQQVEGVSQEHLAAGAEAGARLQAENDLSRGGSRPDPARAERLGAAARDTNTANAASMGDVAAMMQANPRFARLSGLAGAKNCQGDD